MNFAWLVFKKEIVEFFKDKKTVFFALVMPLILFPVIFTMMVKMGKRDADQRRGQPSKVVLVDPGNVLRKAFESEPAKYQLVPMPPGDFLKAITDEKADLLVEVDAAAAEAKARMETFPVKATFDESSRYSETALKRLKETLLGVDNAVVKERLASLNAPVQLAKPTRMEAKDLSDIGRQLAKGMGSFLPYVLLIVMYAGAMQNGAYMSAGERERGTLISLLATRMPRSQIILGKQLALFALSMLAVLSNLASMGFGMARMGQEIQVAEAAAGRAAGSMEGFSAIANPTTLLLCFLLLLPLAFLFSAFILMVGTQAKNTREATTALTPGIFVVIMLGVFSMSPGIEKMAALPYVPILNVSLAIRKLFSQQANAYEYAVALLMTVGLAALMTWQSSRVLSRESALFKGGD